VTRFQRGDLVEDTRDKILRRVVRVLERGSRLRVSCENGSALWLESDADFFQLFVRPVRIER